MAPIRPSLQDRFARPQPRTSIIIKPFKITRLHAHEGSSESAAPSPETGPAPEQQPSLAPAPEPSKLEAAAPPPEPKKGSALKSYVQQSFVQPTKSLQKLAGRQIYPGANERSLSYLTGTLPGDFGWDPLHLADTNDQDPLNNTMSMSWLSYAEVIHCRWAMLGAAGALAPEVLGKAGIIPEATSLTWFQAGGLDSASSLIAVPFSGPIPFEYWTDQYTLLWTMLVAMGFAEGRRWQEYKQPGTVQKQFFLGLEKATPSSQQPAYPGGGFFNFAGLGAKDEKQMFELKVKEIRNGRLAMLAFLGFMVQAEVTHKGPFQNLLDHIGHPSVENLASRITN